VSRDIWPPHPGLVVNDPDGSLMDERERRFATGDRQSAETALSDNLYLRRGDWRHAKWCSFERDEPTACDCGLDAARAALPASTESTGLGDMLDCPVCESGDIEHKRAEGMDLPERIIVGADGAYWRDYGDHYSMPPVNPDNSPVKPAAVYVRAGRS